MVSIRGYLTKRVIWNNDVQRLNTNDRIHRIARQQWCNAMNHVWLFLYNSALCLTCWRNGYPNSLFTRNSTKGKHYGKSILECLPYFSGNAGIVKENLLITVYPSHYMLFPWKGSILHDVVMTESELVSTEITLGQLHLITTWESGNNERSPHLICQSHPQCQASVLKPS